ncbi:glycosyltransferase [Sphingomonas sp. PB4P5]|uniref:glycosyltransferase n=1 Tax=Parasphingomonas puruogangriensis TaxID=3096155 RepID=UPI002FC94EF6
MAEDFALTGASPDSEMGSWSGKVVPLGAPRGPNARRLATAFDEPALGPIELSVIVPTYNERNNLDELVAQLDQALPGIRWEVIVVDDNSPDGTADHARRLHGRNARVRVIQRIGRRGLASACIEGMLASSAPYLAVMDGDLQHDPRVLPAMLDILRGAQTDLVAASRYMAGGSIGEWGQGRAATSQVATRVARALTPVDLSDPMSGFFAIRREVIDRWAPSLSGIGFKILLDLAMTAGPGLRIREVPLRFACRQEGASKLSAAVAWDYAMMIADKLIGQIVPVRLLAFLLVGGAATLVHFAAMAVLIGLGGAVIVAQAIATALALLTIYAIDNLVAHKPRPRRGLHWLSGLIGFAAVSAVGAVASVGAAVLLSASGFAWPVGAALGAAILLVWNYGAAAHYSWRAA